MKTNKLMVFAALAVVAGVSHAVVTTPQTVVNKDSKEFVDVCKLFPDTCDEGTDGMGNGGGKEPPQ
ncbi:hypothetical protein [Alteromonas facilis]|uniref:hypothetical protein n=1 Tax=Alteromonas facilis TaxID=2048004 RepID=UPI000F5C93C2|nr:hypothetical protein [Alteromonas facilis]